MSRADTWMPLYIGDYLADTMHLTTQEHGAYLLLIMRYWRNGPLPDDDKFLAGIARVDRKTWASDVGPTVRAFFSPENGRLHHKRIDFERQCAQQITEQRRSAAEARWGKRKEQTTSAADAATDAGGPQTGCGDDANAYANASVSHDRLISPSPSPSPSQEERKKAPPPAVGPPVAALRPRAAGAGCRLPTDWQPSEQDRDFAANLGLDATRVAQKFRDHWLATVGKHARKSDWSAAWRNWCRDDAERAAARPKPRFSAGPRGALEALGLGVEDDNALPTLGILQ